jgi:multiple sugar transport system substrate-binding protein
VIPIRRVVRPLVAAVAVATFGISGSLTSALPASASSANTTIIWTSVASGTPFATDITAAFHQANPSITVIDEPQSAVSNVHRALISEQLAEGSSTPDVYSLDQTWPAEGTLNGWDVPLTKLIPHKYFSGMPAGLVRGYQYKGVQVAVPYFSDVTVLYYRKDLLAKYNLPVPTTWEQLATEAQQLQKDGAVQYGFLYFGANNESSSQFWCSLIKDAGGSTINSNYTAATVNSAAGLKVMNFLASTIASGITPEAISTFGPTEVGTEFAQGQTAFMAANAYQWPTIVGTGLASKVGVAAPPTFAGEPGPGAACSGGDGAWINPYSKHLAADVKFLEFLTSPTAQQIIATVGHLQPATTAELTNPAVDAVDPVAPLLPTLRIINRQSGTKYYPDLTLAISSNMNAVISGSEKPSDALVDMSTQINAALKGLMD